MTDLPTLYQAQIHRTKYARWREEDNRRESWDETVDRYLAAQCERSGDLLPADVVEELREAIVGLAVMPSMRSMMTSGKALTRDNVAGYNPVAGDTLVLTREEGLVPIATLDGHHRTVVNVDGRWTRAEFRGYGEQLTCEVQLRLNSNSQKTVRATANHRWILDDGRVVPTEQLQPGDRIPFVASSRPEVDSLDYRLGIIHGLIYGDGTATYSQERLKGYHIRLCGDHADLLPYFEGHPVTYPPSANGDPVVMLYGAFAKTHSLKDLPWEGETDEYLVGFVRGWLAADGSVSRSSQVTLTVTLRGRLWFDRVASRLGYVVQRVAELPARTNYGLRKQPALNLFVSRSSLVSEDFLIERKRTNFRSLESHYVVVAVEQGRVEPVYCAEVPDTNTFVLDQGLVTGNCAYLAINRPHAFDEALYILCCGTGVGFSVERQYVNQLPEVPTPLFPSDTTIVVRDSKIGWASSLRQLINLLYGGVVPQWDVSRVRPAGARLKTFGGRASGPGALIDLFRYVVETFKAAQGRKLSSLECHGIMCKIGDIVVVGGVRRSALISLSNPSDDRMRDAKAGRWDDAHPEYALANNSAVWTEKPSMERFLDEWISLIKSKSGERGIINRQGMQAIAARNGRRDANHEFGTNPCSEIILRDRQFCVAGDTPLITSDGIVDIADVVDESVEIWNGQEWSEIVVRKTRSDASLVRITLSDGSYLDCTPDHRFSVNTRFENTWREVEAQHLLDSRYKLQLEPHSIEHPGGRYVASAYTLGFAVGDGHVYGNRVSIDLYGEKDWQCPVEGRRGCEYLPPGYSVAKVRTKTTLEPDLVSGLKKDALVLREIAEWDCESTLEFFAGLADADGSETGTGGIRIYISQEARARTAQLLLSRCGVRSSVCLLHRAGTVTNKGIRKHDLWYLQITDCGDLPCHRLDTSQGHAPRMKGKYQTVRSIESITNGDVYCFNEPIHHKAVFANVLTHQCNLSEVVVRPEDTLETLHEKVRLATILGTLQSTFTDFRYLSAQWKKNCEEERLLGVSLTGIMDHPVLSGSCGSLGEFADSGLNLREALEALRQVAIDTNAEWADKLGINPATAITCVKPSGTVSQLVDAASGIHPRWARYYIRTNRAGKSDPVSIFLWAKGIPFEDELLHPDTTWVFSYPMHAPEESITRDEVSALDQLRLWLVYADHWCEHKPSITVYVRDDEWLEVGAFVYKHFDRMSGVSFLPHSEHSYKQAPYQEINEAEYARLTAEMPDSLDWDDLPTYEQEDNTEGMRELACSAGACEVV